MRRKTPRGDGLRPKIESLINEDTYFVMIGANDGYIGDPLYNMIYEFNMRGIFFEPIEECFLKLKENYKKHPRYDEMIFHQECVTETDGMIDFYINKKDSSCSTADNTIGAYKKEFRQKRLVKTQCPSQTLATLNKNLTHHIDLLQIDTEGLDWLIIKQILDLSKLPHIIHFEKKNFSDEHHKFCLRFLDDYNYKVERGDSRHDYLAIRKG